MSQALQEAIHKIHQLNNPEYLNANQVVLQALRNRQLNDCNWKGVTWFIRFQIVLSALLFLKNFRKENWGKDLSYEETELANFILKKYMAYGKEELAHEWSLKLT